MAVRSNRCCSSCMLVTIVGKCSTRDCHVWCSFADGQRAVHERCEVIVGSTKSAHVGGNGVGAIINSAYGTAGETRATADHSYRIGRDKASNLGRKAGKRITIEGLELVISRHG